MENYEDMSIIENAGDELYDDAVVPKEETSVKDGTTNEEVANNEELYDDTLQEEKKKEETYEGKCLVVY